MTSRYLHWPLLLGALILGTPRVGAAQVTSGFDSWQGHQRLSNPSTWSSAENCFESVTSSIDADLRSIRTGQTRIANISYGGSGAETTLSILDGILVNHPDPSLAGGDEEIQEMAEVRLPDELVVAMAMVWGANLPGVDSASGNEDALYVLELGGDIDIVSRQHSGSVPWDMLPWPADYRVDGTIPAPPLPSGTTTRLYCDIDVLHEGDIVLAFAQDPVIIHGGTNYYQEGYVRYDHQTSTWETPVTSLSGIALRHPSKSTGASPPEFNLQSCISIDHNRFENLIGLVSNTSSLATRSIWLLDKTSSGAFPVADVAFPVNYPVVGGFTDTDFGHIEDIAVLNDHVVLLQQDRNATDGIRMWDLDTADDVADFTSHALDLNAIAVTEMPGIPECDQWRVFAAMQNPPTSPNLGDGCSTFYSIPLNYCD